MRHRLQTRFILAGGLLVAATVGSSVWSAFTFIRLNRAVDETIRVSQETIDLSAELHSSLEREDDALLLFLSGNVEQARRELEAERRRGDRGFERLTRLVTDGNEQALLAQLRQQIERYRAAGDALLDSGGKPGGLEQYHLQVNPSLRQAVACCDRLREAYFRLMEQTGVRARDEAARGIRWVAAISVLTVALGIGIAVWLARSVLGPVRELTASLEAVRKGDFDRRIRQLSSDELGQLGAGFNRMAEALAEYRRSSLGELLAAKRTLEATLDALPDAVFVFGPDGELVAANPLARNVLAGKRVGSAVRLADIPFSDDQHAAITEALAGRPRAAPRLDFTQTFNVVLDGQPRRFLVTAVPIPDFLPGRCGAAVVLDDVTDFARLDELRSELIGVASHELKSPLTALRMNLLMLGEGAAGMTERQRQLVAAAVAGCEELALTIEELLDVTRIEAGQLRLDLAPVDLEAVLATVQKSMQPRFDDAGVRLVVTAEDGPVVVRGDPARLRSVLANLLSNALKYSPAGGVVEVELSSRQNAQSASPVTRQIAVTDQGPGVPAEFRERVFEKFFRVEHHTADRPETVRGTGIGLYLCREIVKAHGGSITCEPGPGGRGTRFVITLPGVADPSAPARASAPDRVAAVPSLPPNSFPPAERERRQTVNTALITPSAPSRSWPSDRPSDVAGREVSELLASLGSSPDGLSRVQSLQRLARDGFNEIAHQKPPRWYVQLLMSFQTPFNYLLLTLAVVAFLTEDYKATVVISVMVAISGLLRFWQEFRSGREAERLRALVHTTATVARPGSNPEETPIRNLVVGDVVHLSAGDLIPADVRVLSSKDLFVSQAALTGESIPVEKSDVAPAEVHRLLEAHVSPLDLPNICFMGTSVVSGTAKAVVFATGSRTYLGSLAQHLVGKRAETAFDKGVRSVSWLLIRFMIVMAPTVFILNGITKADWAEAFLFAVAIAVGLTPEMLPMIVTANLARGAVAMSRKKVIVKRLQAIQNLGALDVLCTDKTGTLTQDKVVLIQHLDLEGKECEEVLEYAYLNSYFQTGLKNLLDRAILEHEDLIETRELTKRYIKYDEVPFDFHRRRMSVIVHEVFKARDLLICKGAVEEVLSVCTEARIGGTTIPLTDAIRNEVLRLWNSLSEDGLRVIAVAAKQVWSRPNKQYGVGDEEQLTLIGFIAFLDPPKETAGPALAALARHGVTVKILTGDNELVARKVCRDVGLLTSGTLLGTQIEKMSDEELEEAAERTTLFAKLNPTQKARIIAALKRRGHTVGFLGDGINDAPALREADAGISVDTAADIAKESADVILLEKNLLVLEEGVLLGRQTYGNTIKYIKMAASSNFGNVFSVLVASVWLPFLPMLAIHLLIQNLLYDISQVGIPFDRMDDEYLEKPRKWQVNDLGRFMLCIGPISSIFDIITFCVMYFVFAANTPEMQSLFQSGWFVEGLLSQTLIIHMIRTAKIPFLQSTASAPLVVLTLCIMIIGIAVPFSPIGEAVGMVPLPLAYFPWLVAILVCYCLLTQLVKRYYIRRFGMWL